MSDTPPQNSPRRRGAPKGNHNAVKHGFYARQFNQQETSDLSSTEPLALQDEILMLRVFMRRIIERSSEAVTLADNLEVVRVLSLATFSLTRLIRTQLFIAHEGESDFTKAIRTAIDLTSADWK
jgi:hypothetical protein